METVFVIPTFISSKIDDNIVPFLAKLAERQIIMMNANTVRSAAIKKYGNILSTVTTENGLDIELNENIDVDNFEKDLIKHLKESKNDPFSPKISNVTPDSNTPVLSNRNTQMRSQVKSNLNKGFDHVKNYDYTRLRNSNYLDDEQSASEFNKIDTVETPKGISFYNIINFEPTYLQIRIKVKTSLIGSERSTRTVKIGFKCIPMKIDGIKNIFNLMEQYKSKRIGVNRFKSMFNKFKKRIFKSAARKFNPTGIPTVDIVNAPSISDLSDSSILSKMMISSGPSYWAPLTILSYYDFEETGKTIRDMMRSYNKIVKNGWGDIMVMHEPKNSLFLCTQKLSFCQELPLFYLKMSMKLDPVLDYLDVIKGYSSGTSWNPKSTSLVKAFSESDKIITDEEDLEVISELTKKSIRKNIFGKNDE